MSRYIGDTPLAVKPERQLARAGQHVRGPAGIIVELAEADRLTGPVDRCVACCYAGVKS